MPINVQGLRNYGGNLVNQKYQPIDKPDPTDPGLRQTSLDLFAQRIATLSNLGKFPQTLYFYTGGQWGALQALERTTGSLPPVVVISSNRSTWIAGGFDRATTTVNGLGIPNFTDVNDLRVFSPGFDGPTPAWYSPLRVADANRRTYILVHVREMKKYYALRAHANANLHVIGWSFFPTKANDNSCVGFGASRFAAIEFCKLLRRGNPTAAPWNYAWLIDDNVVYLNSFPTFATSEQYMTDNGLIALGFRGETATFTTVEMTRKNRDGRFHDGGIFNNVDTTGVLQQAALWNITELDRLNLNFSPYFIASAEDTSLTNYLVAQGHAIGISTGTSITKETPSSHDNDASGKAVNAARNWLQRRCAIVEAETRVVPTDRTEGREQALAEYLYNKVLSDCQPDIKSKKDDITTQEKAVCQAAEVILSEAVKQNGFYPAEVFFPNGHNQQVVNVS